MSSPRKALAAIAVSAFFISCLFSDDDGRATQPTIPGQGEQDVSITPAFFWDGADTSEGLVQIALDPEFATIVWTGTLHPGDSLPDALSNGTDYWWRVGSSPSSEVWSRTFSFSTEAWTRLPKPELAGLETVSDLIFISPAKGFLLADDNQCSVGVGCWGAERLYATENGGESWAEYAPPGLSETPDALHFPDADTGFACSAAGCAVTRDGGESWSPIPDITGREIVFWGLDTGWILEDQNGSFHRTVDGGRNWSHVSAADTTVAGMRDIVVAGATILVGLGHHGIVLRSGDGGSTWSSQTVPNAYNLNATHHSHGSSWIAGFDTTGRSIVMKSRDGGLSWSRMNSPDGIILYDIAFLDSLTGYAVGTRTPTNSTENPGVIIETRDGGSNWSLVTSIESAPTPTSSSGLNRVVFSGRKGWIAGLNNFLFKTSR